MSRLIDDLREELAAVVEQTPAPPTADLARVTARRGQRIRARRRTAGVVLVAACLLGVALTFLGHDGEAPGPGPSRATSSPTTSTGFSHSLDYRATGPVTRWRWSA